MVERFVVTVESKPIKNGDSGTSRRHRRRPPDGHSPILACFPEPDDGFNPSPQEELVALVGRG